MTYGPAALLGVLLTLGQCTEPAWACAPQAPPMAPLAPGHGWWQDNECRWTVVPCATLTEFRDDVTVRLAVGCDVLGPRIGYTSIQDTTVRTDLAGAKVALPACTAELARCRQASKTQYAADTEALRTCEGREQDALRQRDVSQGVAIALQERSKYDIVQVGAVTLITAVLGILFGKSL